MEDLHTCSDDDEVEVFSMHDVCLGWWMERVGGSSTRSFTVVNFSRDMTP